MREPDHYAVLGVDPHAPEAEVRAAWRFALQAFHPDRFRDEAQRVRADGMAKRVNAAWQVLGDPLARRRYDAARAAAEGTTDDGVRTRRVPCPACTSMSAVADDGAGEVTVRCPACGQVFTAYVGVRLDGRPRLESRLLGGFHTLTVVDGRGRASEVRARRLPAELALADGETVSLVMGARGRGARYMVIHTHGTDLGWKVG